MVVKSIINSEKLSLQNAELWLNLVGVLGVFFEFRKRKSSHKAKLGLATGYSGFKFQLAWRLFLLTSGNWANVFLQPWWWIRPDWLMMIAYIALFSALLSRLTALPCGSTWVTSFIARFWISTEVVYLQRWHGWCHMKLQPSRCKFCVHHTTMHHVTSCKATYIRCMRV